MSLRDRLNDIQQQPATSVNPMTLRSQEDQAYQDLKSSIHSRLLERIDLAAMENMPEDRLRGELKLQVEQLHAEQGTVLNQDERARLVRDIKYEGAKMTLPDVPGIGVSKLQRSPVNL